MVHLQDFILEHLHHHILYSMTSNGTYEAHHTQILSCFSLRASAWFRTWPIFPTFWLSSLIFCITLHTQLGLPHLSIASILQCVCTHPIDSMGIHILCCVHGNECIKTYDVICNTFTTIARDVNFHMKQEQLHVLPSTTFNSFHWWIDIVLTKNGICILVNIVIVDPTQAGLFPILCNLRICCFKWNSRQGKELSQLIPQWLITPLSNWGMWLVTQTCRCVYTIVPMPFGAWRG
jgi:hypothetical protein